jgi:predicted MFS family arabinose efflux permease
VAQVAGPGVAGTLMELLGPPFALLVDAGSFVASWASLLWIRTPEPAPERKPVGQQRSIRTVLSDIRAGLRFIYWSPVLRAVAGSASIFNFFSQLQITLFLVYAPRVEHISADGVGLIFVCLGLGGVAASFTARRHVTSFGYGPMLLTGYALGAAAVLCIGLVPGSRTTATAIFTVVYFICGYGLVTATIAMTTLRQVVTPESLQGRVNASFQFAIMALMPFSALLAGLLGEQFGLRPALFVCSAGMPISVIWIFLSPARKVRAAEAVAPPEPEPRPEPEPEPT